MTIQEFMDKHDLKLTAEFVPFSKSRNAGESQPLLNWKVTLSKGEREVLTSDYMAGMAHCPSYRRSAVLQTQFSMGEIRKECETGRHNGEPINPDPLQVLASLAMDADVLDYPDFEEWAESFGYDPDSRAAEKTYNACMDIALKLRSALGDEELNQLKEAASQC